ncbi:MAG: class I SAM-dependent methyltransferase [Pseudodesulfovibrio sp.]|nr:class I SAM-dependent methyltransferase [Pseudodesulfovibrio sp.]
MPSKSEIICRLCGSRKLNLVQKGSKDCNSLNSESFAITDSNYGEITDLYQCEDCDLLQCHGINDLNCYYESLVDKDYEAGRKERSIQQMKVLEILCGYKSSGRLLDVGAGSGILVEQALKMGFEAEGVEPSRWLVEKALERKLIVHNAIFPSEKITSKYEVITLVDIIEHVDNPVEVLCAARNLLTKDGIGVVVTPDVDSFFARLLKRKWWHYRIAHVNYFSLCTINMALRQAGLESLAVFRPKWYFSASYLAIRVMQYFPKCLRFTPPSFLNKIIIPLNLFDSYMIIFRRRDGL